MSSDATEPTVYDLGLFTPSMTRAELAEEFGRPMNGGEANGMLPSEVPWWVDMVDADETGMTGEGVYVAVLDTGLLEDWPWIFSQANIASDLGIGYTHEFWWDGGLQIGPLITRDFITNEIGSGHGTHVTSTIVGYNLNDLWWAQGVAPVATIIPVLVLDAWLVDTPDGELFLAGGTDEMVAAGIYYAADLASTYSPMVISMSLGGPEPTQIIEDAINYAISMGCIVVASAGNEGYFGMGWPGAYPQVISVGAAGWTEQFFGPGWVFFQDVPEMLNTKDYLGNNWQVFLEEFSSRANRELGQSWKDLDVVDPGAAVLGPYKPYGYFDWAYYYVWGTSMAAPHVSAIAAQVLEMFPFVDQATMEMVLREAGHGHPLPPDGSWVWDPWYGYWHFEWGAREYGTGFLQADAAMESAMMLC